MLIYNADVLDIHATRAGVIPYTIDKTGNLHFLLGIDKKTRELTDFGGGIKKYETVVEGALRELHEESCHIFIDEITESSLEKSTILVSNRKDAVLFLVYISPKWLGGKAMTAFRQNQSLCRSKKYHELICVKWICQEYFAPIAFNPRNHCMWKKIQHLFLFSGLNWTELKTLLVLNHCIKV